MQKKIYCEQPEYGQLRFYLEDSSGQHYLFTQNFNTGVNNYYKNGVSVDAALDFSRAGDDFKVLHTMEKLPAFLRYLEKECDVPVFRQSGKQRRGKSARRRRRYEENWTEAG